MRLKTHTLDADNIFVQHKCIKLFLIFNRELLLSKNTFENIFFLLSFDLILFFMHSCKARCGKLTEPRKITFEIPPAKRVKRSEDRREIRVLVSTTIIGYEIEGESHKTRVYYLRSFGGLGKRSGPACDNARANDFIAL